MEEHKLIFKPDYSIYRLDCPKKVDFLELVWKPSYCPICGIELKEEKEDG